MCCAPQSENSVAGADERHRRVLSCCCSSAATRSASRSTLRPFSFTVRRGGRRLLRAAGRVGRRRHGPRPLRPVHRGRDRAGGAVRRSSGRSGRSVVAREDDDGVVLATGAWTAAGQRACGSACRPTIGLSLSLLADGEPLRLGARLGPALGGALRRPRGAPLHRSSTRPGATVQLGADRRYTGPDCPPEMLAAGGIPQGDCAPVPWLLSSRGYGAWVQTDANGTRFELAGERDVGLDPGERRAAAARAAVRTDAGGAPARVLPADRLSRRCCPSGATASGRAATSTSTRTTCSTTSTAFAATRSRSTRS